MSNKILTDYLKDVSNRLNFFTINILKANLSLKTIF